MTDLRVEWHGSITLLRPLTDEGASWLADFMEFEPWQKFGQALAVETWYVACIVQGAREGGLEVA